MFPFRRTIAGHSIALFAYWLGWLVSGSSNRVSGIWLKPYLIVRGHSYAILDTTASWLAVDTHGLLKNDVHAGDRHGREAAPVLSLRQCLP